jgi:deazaflavin-dependent oxidoreductase (nitroreductase family)
MRARPLTAYEQAVERLASTRAGAWLFVHLLCHADRPVLAHTSGRRSMTPGAPVGLLETVGARTGRTRRTPLVYAADGGDLLVVASNGGRARHPAWVHNLRAKPEVRFLSREHGWRSYRAAEAGPGDHDRRWAIVVDLYAGYETYRRRSGGRHVPVVVLEPADG